MSENVNAKVPDTIVGAISGSTLQMAIAETIWPPKGPVTEANKVYARLKEQNPDLDRKAVLEVFKAFASAGLGRYIIGRRGFPTRFEWLSDAPSRAEEDISSRGSRESSMTIRHSFVLRPEYSVELELPLDFSRSEARRLSEFVMTLPFENREEGR